LGGVTDTLEHFYDFASDSIRRCWVAHGRLPAAKRLVGGVGFLLKLIVAVHHAPVLYSGAVGDYFLELGHCLAYLIRPSRVL
jgi:hypothetical protein